MMEGRWYEYVGNVHVHSNYSDGAFSPPQIAGVANRVGLDFVIINDHDYMTNELHLELEGFYDGLLLLMGLEIGGRYHHYLAFDLKEMVLGKGLTPQQVIDSVHAQEGFGFLAHPFEKGMPFVEKSIAYTWNDLNVSGYTGICIWNFTSRWKERIRSPLHGLFFLVFKSFFLKGPSRNTLSFWDEKCREGHVVAIGGSDAHGSQFKWGPLVLRPLSYHFLLQTINIHILLKKPMSRELSKAKTMVYDAMKRGALYIAHDGLKRSDGFRFYYLCSTGVVTGMGEQRDFSKGWLVVELPLEGRVRLLRNGRPIMEGEGKEFHVKVPSPGVYRVETSLHLPLLGWRPWIFSNPIWIL